MKVKAKKKPTKAELQLKKITEATQYDYFDVSRISYNEQAGIMIGTPVKKVEEPKCQNSKFWGDRDYWSVKVQCPNGEIKTISVDSLDFRKTAKPFNAVARAYDFKFKKKK